MLFILILKEIINLVALVNESILIGWGNGEVSLIIVLCYIYFNNMLVGWIMLWCVYVEYFLCKVIGNMKVCFTII
jgi:hypothetical protein